MEEMIKRILQVDDENVELVAKAEQRREIVNKEIESESKIIHEQCAKDAADKIEKLNAAERKKAQNSVAADKQKFEQIIAQINSSYANNKQRWVDSVTKNVVKLEW